MKNPFDKKPEAFITISPEIIGIKTGDPRANEAMKHLFIQTITGDGMYLAGILDGDYIIFDSSMEPSNGDIVTACVDDNLVCRRYLLKDGKTYFRRENGITPDVTSEDYKIYGVMVGLIRNKRQTKCE